MKYKALILDVDGTAVVSGVDSVPSPKVRKAIHAAQARNIYVSVSTSRPIFVAKKVIRLLGIKDPCAINDATQLYDPKTEKVIKTFPLSKKAIWEVSRHFQKRKLSFMVNVGESEQYYKGGPFPDTVCSLCIPELPVPMADLLINSLTHISDIAVQKPPSFKGNLVWVSVTSSIATKLHSVLEITKLLGIKPKEVIGVGDGYNDYPLLSACGLKIAMGNAVSELKAIADFVVPPVEEDGVATVIEKFILTR